MLKRIMLSVLLSSSACTFGVVSEPSFVDGWNRLFFLAKVLPNNEHFRIEVTTTADDLSQQQMCTNGKFFISNDVLSLVMVLITRPLIRNVTEETAMKEASINLGRYQPTYQQVALFVHDVLGETVATEGAKIIVRKTSLTLTEEEVRFYAFKPKDVALRIAEKSIHEGFYRLVCAEVHKRGSLKRAHNWFPTGNDDTKAEEMSVQGFGYSIKYGITRFISESASGAVVGAVKAVASARGL